MSICPSPKLHNGSLNTIFNNTDYIKVANSGGGATIAQTDARYLKNAGAVVSSANTTFNGTLNVRALATIVTLTVSKLLKSKQTADTLTSDIFRATKLYSFSNGMVYSTSVPSLIPFLLSIFQPP
jgi:hypothetical protein